MSWRSRGPSSWGKTADGAAHRFGRLQPICTHPREHFCVSTMIVPDAFQSFLSTVHVQRICFTAQSSAE